MAEILRIATESGGDYYDLLSGPLRIRMGRYVENNRGNVIERRYSLTSHFNNDDERLGVMEAQKEIERFAKRAREWADRPSDSEAIWLEETASAEVPYRRSLLVDITIRPTIIDLAGPLLTSGGLFGDMVVSVARHSESSIPHTQSFSSVSALGGKVILPPGGVEDGRISQLTVGAAPFPDTWKQGFVGIRSRQEGTDDFDPLLDCTVISSLPTGSSVVSDAAAYGNDTVEVDFDTGGATMSNRLTGRLGTAGGFFPSGGLTQYVGAYNLILGYRITAGDAIIGVRARYGNRDNIITNETQYVRSKGALVTSYYYLVNLGRVVIPSVPWRSVIKNNMGDVLRYFTIYIDAELVAGDASSDHLYFDTAVLVPARRFGSFDSDAGIQASAKFFTFADDERLVMDAYGQIGAHNLSYPSDGGVAVFAVEGNANGRAQHTFTATIETLWRYGRYAGNGG